MGRAVTSYNAPAALVIPTPDDVGTPIHPGIVHLEQPVGGYAYWMAFTPYPSGSDVLENPCVVASNDGVTWVVPDGVTNPLDPIPGDPPMVQGSLYNSDTDIAFVDGKLYLFWRRNDGAYARIYVRTSTDGVVWHLAASRDGLHWHVGACVLEPVKAAPGVPGAWDSGAMYRGTLLVEGDTIRVWYTAMGRRDSIGYTEVPLIELSSALDALAHA